LNTFPNMKAPKSPRADKGLHGPRLSKAAFRRIAALAMREAGLSIAESKADMVRTRLARRLRALQLVDFDDYCSHVESAEGQIELGLMISALTTNVSHFFREKHHFELLKTQILPELARRPGAEPIRIWSAGCANGQEPYSIAMTLAEADLHAVRGARILATDIDPTVVEFGKAGAYPEHMLGGLSEQQRSRFLHQQEKNGQAFGVDLRSMISFRVLNLLNPWPMTGQFDVIFCRNVVIYFDMETQATLWRRFASILAPGGWLMLGHSERIHTSAEKYFGKAHVTAYRRTGELAPLNGKVR